MTFNGANLFSFCLVRIKGWRMKGKKPLWYVKNIMRDSMFHDRIFLRHYTFIVNPLVL